MKYLISDIKLPFFATEEEIIEDAVIRMKRVGFYDSALHFRLYKRSLDARNRDNILSVSSVIAESSSADKPSKHFDPVRAARYRISLVEEEEYGSEPLNRGNEKMTARPLVVGMGPAGLFAALMLAENGYSPMIIDRGDRISDRVSAVDMFYKSGKLDTESNVQFGEGGAGTFSDGKLVTRINDKRCGYVLKRFFEAGAPDEILTKAKPHIGTDVLRGVISKMTERIAALGGTVIYRCKLEGICEYPDGSICAKTSKGDIRCGAVVLAVGHSARDTYKELKAHGFSMAPKPFSIGVRVEHLQEDIDAALFGKYAGHKMLGPGEYNLSDTTTGRGVYTFCMCPGGEVVAGASEAGGVVVNGMSNHARDGKNANCATAVSVLPDDVEKYMRSFGTYNDPIDAAIEFQRTVERRAFEVGGGDFFAPIQLMGDFLEGRVGREPKRIMPTYMGGERHRVSDLSQVLPQFVCESLRRGFGVFDRRIKGFAVSDAVLTAVESRTTSPVRILRRNDLRAEGHPLVYPCGEGAGYAGGITSAAVDGLRCAEAIIERFKPVDL